MGIGPEGTWQRRSTCDARTRGSYRERDACQRASPMTKRFPVVSDTQSSGTAYYRPPPAHRQRAVVLPAHFSPATLLLLNARCWTPACPSQTPSPSRFTCPDLRNYFRAHVLVLVAGQEDALPAGPMPSPYRSAPGILATVSQCCPIQRRHRPEMPGAETVCPTCISISHTARRPAEIVAVSRHCATQYRL